VITRPLLAATIEDFETIKFPLLATPKLDGIRVLKIDGKVLTRKFKELPNRDVRSKLEFILPDGIDGEIMLRNGNFNQIQSEIMSFDGAPDYIFYAFDWVKDDLNKPYLERMRDLEQWYNDNMLKFIALSKIQMGVTTIDPDNFRDKIRLLLPKKVNTLEELQTFEEECIENKFEGAMIRSIDGRYKCGRSTLREGILGKIKRFIDDEAVIIGFKEKLQNTNKQEEDNFGLSKRSHKKEGMIPANTLGALMVQNKEGIKFEVGSGFDDELKKEIWMNQEKYLNQTITYKYQKYGMLEDGSPRFPVFLRFRHPDA